MYERMKKLLGIVVLGLLKSYPINYGTTGTILEPKEIKINLSWVFYVTPCNKCLRIILIKECPRGEIGRHKGLKAQFILK